MGFYGILWIPMDYYGFLWIPMDSYGIPMDSYVIPWISLDFYEFLWIPLAVSHLFPSKAIDIQGVGHKWVPHFIRY